MVSALILVAALAVADPPTVPAVISARSDLPIAVATGPIDETFSHRLSSLLDQDRQVKVLLIESPGGLSIQAYEAARILNGRDIEVRVRGRCASACALLWSSANRRALYEGAHIGLHSGVPESDTPWLLRGFVHRRESKRAVEALSHAGFPQTIISRAEATPQNSMLWLGVPELVSSGVQFTLVSASTLQAPSDAPNYALQRAVDP